MPHLTKPFLVFQAVKMIDRHSQSQNMSNYPNPSKMAHSSPFVSVAIHLIDSRITNLVPESEDEVISES